MKIDSKFKPVETMMLKDAFNNSDYDFAKLTPTVLRVRMGGGVSIGYFYDFGMRIMTARYDGGLSTQPFSQLDRETLIELRDKLVELGGKPPELPRENNPAPQAKRGLNL